MFLLVLLVPLLVGLLVPRRTTALLVSIALWAAAALWLLVDDLRGSNVDGTIWALVAASLLLFPLLTALGLRLRGRWSASVG